MKKDEKKYSAMCPVCERKLFRAIIADGAEVCCPKCRAKLEVGISEGSIHVREIETEQIARPESQ